MCEEVYLSFSSQVPLTTQPPFQVRGKETFCAGLNRGQAHSAPVQINGWIAGLEKRKALAVRIRQRRCLASVGLLYSREYSSILHPVSSKAVRKQVGDILAKADPKGFLGRTFHAFFAPGGRLEL
jgi:hypothetical protein